MVVVNREFVVAALNGMLWATLVAVTLAVLVIMIVRDVRNDGRIYASYVLVVAGTTLFAVTFRYMGQADWWIGMLDKLLM